LARIKGSHYIYTKENISVIIVIPIHGNRDLPIGTLKGILKDSGLTEDDI
jgi:predicted RNA binding protein YcfA (HicA-like mRNA interferase family)